MGRGKENHFMRVAFDIGANMGTKSREFLALGFDRIIAVEPLYDSPFPESEKRVTWIKSLVSDSLESRPIYPLGTISTVETSFMEGRFKGSTWGAPVMAKATTLSHLIQEYGIPEYIKIDVEGHELNVIQGMPAKAIVRLLSFEWHSECREAARDCLTVLAGMGYSQFALQQGDRTGDEFDKWHDSDGLMSAFDAHCATEPLRWGQIFARIT